MAVNKRLNLFPKVASTVSLHTTNFLLPKNLRVGSYDEVLPTIRKTRGYVSDDEIFINTYLPFADDNTKRLFKITLECAVSAIYGRGLFLPLRNAHTTHLMGKRLKLSRRLRVRDRFISLRSLERKSVNVTGRIV